MRAEVHPPVAHEDDVGQAVAQPQLLDLGLHGGRIGGVAGKGLDRDRAAPCIGQQAELDLRAIGPVVAAVPVARQRAVAALDIGAREVVQDERARGQMAGRQRALDPVLAGQQPVECAVQLVLRRAGHGHDLPECRLAQQPGGRELGRGTDHPARDERHREIPLTRRTPIEERLQAE